MRRFALGGLIVLLVGISYAEAAPKDDDGDAPAKATSSSQSSSSGLRRFFMRSDDKATKKVPPKSDKDSAKAKAKAENIPPAPLPKPLDPNAQRLREEKTLQRRQAVVLRLQEIALETNDQELERVTEKLNERVWAQYMQRVANLPASKAVFRDDEGILNQHLSSEPLASQPSLVQPRAGVEKKSLSRTAEVEGKR